MEIGRGAIWGMKGLSKKRRLVIIGGAGTASPPTVQASSIVISSVTATGFTINWTNGNGSSRIVLMRLGGAVNSDPVDGTEYTANAAFGTGSQIGSGNYVVKLGSGPVIITGLSPDTTYHIAVYELNGSGSATNYLQTAPATTSQKTFFPTDLGANLILHVNGRTQTGKTKSGALSEILDGFISNEGNARAFTWSAAATNKSYHGEGEGSYIFTDTSNLASYTNAETAPYKCLSDATESVIIWRGFIADWLAGGTTNRLTIFQNQGGATTGNTGLHFYLTRTDAVPLGAGYRITKSVGGQNVLLREIPNVLPAFTRGYPEYITLMLWKVPTTGGNVRCRLYLNGTLIDDATSTNPINNANPALSANVFSALSTTDFGSQDLIIVNRSLTTDELIQMNSYLDISPVAGADAVVGSLNGQSNAFGTTSGVAPTAPLQGVKDMLIGSQSGSGVSAVGIISAKLQYGVNNDGSLFGPETAFGHQCHLNQANKVFLCKITHSGTSMYADWSTTLGLANSYGLQAVKCHVDIAYKVRFRFNRNVIANFMLWLQGESDALGGNPAAGGDPALIKSLYKADLIALFQAFSDQLAACNFSATIQPVGVQFGLGRTYETQINEAHAEAVAVFGGTTISLVGRATHDGTHYTGASQELIGADFFNAVNF